MFYLNIEVNSPIAIIPSYLCCQCCIISSKARTDNLQKN